MKRRAFLCVLPLLAAPGFCKAGAFEDFFRFIQFDDDYRLKALLLKGMDPNTVNEQGFPGLIYAMMQESPKAVSLLLLSPKTDVNLPDRRGETPLMVASSLNKPDWVASLLARGARTGSNGEWTALHNAAAAGAVPVIELLVKGGAQIDALSPNDTTPLMMAARQGRELAARTLLQLGANPALKNQAGYNAAGYAIKANRNELAMEIMKKERALRKAPLKPQ